MASTKGIKAGPTAGWATPKSSAITQAVADSGSSEAPSAPACFQARPLGRASANTAANLATQRTSTSTAATRPAVASADGDQPEPTATNSTSTSTPPTVPKWRGHTQGRSVRLRSHRPASSGTSSSESFSVLASTSATITQPSTSTTEFSLRRSSRRAMRASNEPSAAPSRKEPKNETMTSGNALSQVPGSLSSRPALSSLSASTAYSVFSADKAIRRSVTWPAALHSPTTRWMTAGDTPIAMMASGPATWEGTPISRAAISTAMPASAASNRLVASSHGLRASQRRFRRAPASNSSSASATSTARRNAASLPSAPRPASASTVPTAA